MVTAILILTGVQVYLELKICNPNGRAWQRKLFSWNRKSPMFGLALSVVLSGLCAMMFGAAGMIVLVSGLLSTMITQVYYGLSDEVFNNVTKSYRDFKAFISMNIDRWHRNFMLVMKFVRLCFKIIIFPITVFIAVLDFMDWVFNRRGKEVADA